MKKNNSISRKQFLQNSVFGVAGLTAIPNIMEAHTKNVNISSENQALTLKNVRLEIGFDYENEEVVGTKTALFLIEIKGGKIASILPNNGQADAIDAQGLLLLPSFRDMHIHLDKTFYGDKWKAVSARKDGVKGMIALEQEMLPEMLKTSTLKAKKLIELLQSKGTAFARSHVNIEPTSKLQSLINLQRALEEKKNGFKAEIVAFPQHGIFYTDTAPYLKEAAQMDIDYIGGLDPFTIDGTIEKPIDFMVQLALDHNKGIDMHLHESGKTGLETVEYLIKKVLENPSLKNKTYLSHGFVLGRIEKSKQEEIAEKLAEAKIGVISTIPFGGLVMPIPTLYKYGVDVQTGNDSIVDHWNTFGTGSVLEKANLFAQLYGYSTEFLLSRALRLATSGITPLDDQGEQQWPKVGDNADLVLVDATCSAEAISRISEVKSLIYNGNVVY